MMRGKKNVLNLTISPPSVPEDNEDADREVDPTIIAKLEANVHSPPSIEDIMKTLSLNDYQKDRMSEWLDQKKKIGELKENELEKICDLGRGNGGVVMKVRHKATDIIMARKLIPLECNPKVKTQIVKELKVLHHCNSPYIVGFYGAFSEDNQISICMEYMDGLSLDIVSRKSGPFPEDILAIIVEAVVNGMQYLKTHFRTVHRDVKPSNILVNTLGEVKLCDFGVSGELADRTKSTMHTFIGTRSYMSPERLQGGSYSIQSDIWSLGVTIVELALGKYPIPALTATEMAALFKVPIEKLEWPEDAKVSKSPNAKFRPAATGTPNSDGTSPALAIFDLLGYIFSEPPPFLPKGIFSKELCDITEKCLLKNPKERISLAGLLEHPFVLRGRTTATDISAWVKDMVNKPMPVDK